MGQAHVPTDVEAIVSFEKGFPNLEQISLNKENVTKLNRQAPFQANFLHKVKFLILQCFHDYADGFPYELFQTESIPNLEKLRVACSAFKEIFCSQRPDVDPHAEMLFSHLKELELVTLWNLESIGLEHSWVAPILENLETLIVKHCHCLENLVPCTVSFSKLRELHVHDCQGLVYLFTLSTARSLVLLEELSIARCVSMQEIVPKEGDESDQDEITFRKLKSLFLGYLERLGSFYSGNFTLNFPCLENVIVHECPRMTVFSCGITNASQHLRVSTWHTKYSNFHPTHCGLDLNASIKLLFPSQLAEFARDVQHLNLGDHPELEDIWLGVMAVPNGGFNQLKTLIVGGCHFLSNNVIPSHLLPFLSNLEELHVRNCVSIKAIFDWGPRPFHFPFL